MTEPVEHDSWVGPKTKRAIDPDTPGCDGGLPLEERLDPDKMPTKEPAEGHQLWVWFRGMNPPRWEIRGTGAMLPESWQHRSYGFGVENGEHEQ